MLMTREFIRSYCCPLKGININELSEEPTWKKVCYFVIFSILNIVLLPFRGLVNVLLTPITVLSKVITCNTSGWDVAGLILSISLGDIIVIPIIGHILFNLLLKLIKRYDKQNSWLDSMLYFTLRPHGFVINHLIEHCDPT